MKNKKTLTEKKLSIKKEAISILNKKQLAKIAGGDGGVWVTTFTSEPTGTQSVTCG